MGRYANVDHEAHHPCASGSFRGLATPNHSSVKPAIPSEARIPARRREIRPLTSTHSGPFHLPVDIPVDVASNTQPDATTSDTPTSV